MRIIHSITTAGTTYAEYRTRAFEATAGAHTLSVVGLNPVGGDHTAFVDDVKVEGAGTAALRWLVADHLGTPRIVVERSGASASVTRHDYLPFGEEVGAGTGGRTIGQGYNGNDTNPFRFAQLRRDDETGLDYAQNRYYSSTQGRFTSSDLPFADQHLGDPQSWNLYTYGRNNPLRFNDPTGRGIGDFFEKLLNKLRGRGFVTTETYLQAEENRKRNWLREQERIDGTLYFRSSADVPWTRLNINNLTREEVDFYYDQFSNNSITDLTPEEQRDAIESVVKQFPEDFPLIGAPWRSVTSSRPLNKMGQASKHLKDFQKIDSNLTDTDVAKILEHVRSVGTSTATQHGGKAFEAVVNIGGKSVTVKVIESAGGVIKTGYPVP
jgi:RHS repeat-associated protein